MRLERLKNLPLNIVTPNFAVIYVFLGTALSLLMLFSLTNGMILEQLESSVSWNLRVNFPSALWVIGSPGLINK
mgnify:CR=1 FL=1